MKKNLFYAMAIAAAFTACSEDNEAVKNPSAEATKGYMTFNISLPSISTTRAQNDVWEEGDDLEYAVEDATICLLNSVKKIIQVESVTPNFNDPSVESTNVERIQVNIEVNATETPAFALVLLNNGTPAKVSVAKDATWNNDLIGSVTATSYMGTRNPNGVATNIFMTNAAIVNEAGNGVQDLTPIEASKHIAASYEEAKSNPVEVYVERIVAKVSMNQSTTNFTTTDGNNISITIQNWELDKTNTSTYPVRKTDNSWVTTGSYINTNATGIGASSNRMIGANSTTPQRVYWAVDGNYDGTGGYTTETFNDATTVDNAFAYVDYCLENTFNVANQKQGQTTRVIIKAKAEPTVADGTSGDFYSLGSSTTLYTKANLGLLIQNAATTAGVSPGSIAEAQLTPSTGGVINIDKTFLEAYLATTLSDDQVTAIQTALGSTINYYKEGICYYVARIKHFGDDLTPWTSATDPNYGSEPDASTKWLGRYGVVRNNWYDLTVTGIRKLGTPEIPTIEPTDPEVDTPDDEKEEYMIFKINILSWAKRNQNVEL